MNTTNQRHEIALDKLVLWSGNVRKTGADTALDELAASIAAHGLLNPLTVSKAPRGKYAVVAGQRRLKALKRLAEAGAIPPSAAVACTVIAAEQDGAELSLAENVMRIAMHPADQFEAWRDLIDKGADVPGIAARFGVAELTVRKRMTLARVSPRIFALYREGNMDLEALQAFTVTNDHAQQEAVWEGLSPWQRRDAATVRRALTEADVPDSDRRVRFVGLDAYEAAGGTVRRDLFAAENGGLCRDAALLDRLVREKIDAAAADLLQAEGWKWAEGRVSFGWEDRRPFRRAGMVEIALPDDVQAEAAAVREEHEQLESGDWTDEARERMKQIDERLDAIEAMARVWPDAVKAVAGAVLSLGYDGSIEIVRGLVREGDAVAVQEDQDGAAGDMSGEDGQEAPALSASLIEELTAQKTAALRIELARSPDTALALVVHRMALEAFYRGGEGVLKTWMTVRDLERSVREHEACPALIALAAERERIGDRLPGNPADLWDWCLKADRDALLDVLAVAAAHGLDAVQGKTDPNRGGQMQGKALAQALKLDMAQWYRPTAEGYFSRIGKAAILADLEAARQAPCAPAWAKMKKAELAVLAEREMADTGWLPEALR